MKYIDLPSLIPDHQWPIYERVMKTATKRRIPYALGGALAMGAYTDRWRPCKDIDMYVLPADKDRMMRVFSDCGLTDYYDQVPYDRRWIFRGYQAETNCIVDAIWAMANMRAHVDEGWLTRGREFRTEGITFRVLPPEELIWSKLYVMQRERCDWPDVLNIMYSTAPTLDWHLLLSRVEDDMPLLKGVLSIFAWMCPSCADYIPDGVRMQHDITAEQRQVTTINPRRVELLDTRPWFGPTAQAA